MREPRSPRRFPLPLFPIVLVAAPIATALSTVVVYLMYVDLQHHLDLVIPEEDYVGPAPANPTSRE